MAEVIFFIAAIAAIAGAVGTVALRNPFFAVLALVCHLLALAALFLLLRAELVAAAQGVRGGGAGGGLRGRGEGVVGVGGRLRGRGGRAAGRSDGRDAAVGLDP